MLDAELVAWIRSVTDATDVAAERRSAGASREGWAIDVTYADGSTQALWLRLDTGHGPQSNTVYTLRREATVYRALEHTAVRVPRVLAVHPTREAFLQNRLYGRNWFAEITDPAEQVRVASDFMMQLVELHRLDPAQLDLPGFDTTATLAQCVHDELDIWERQHLDGPGDLDPLVLVALRWLRRRVPDDGRVVLVQGDTGPGNFMYDDGRVVAVLDWEIAHLGDAYDDLAWICVRDLQERFTHLPDRFAEYAAARGIAFDADRLRYFRVLAQTRCAIGTLNGLAAHDAEGEIANHLIYSTMHLRVLGEALAEVLGVDPSPVVLDADGPTDRTWLYDVALAELQNTIVPNASTTFAARRGKGLARLLKYLRDADRLQRSADLDELRDLEALLGVAHPSVHLARAELLRRLQADDLDDREVVTYGLRRVQRLTRIMAGAMGALADRHHAAIVDPSDPTTRS